METGRKKEGRGKVDWSRVEDMITGRKREIKLGGWMNGCNKKQDET